MTATRSLPGGRGARVALRAMHSRSSPASSTLRARLPSRSARAPRRDADAVLRPFGAETLRQRGHSRLGGSVRGHAARSRASRNGCHVDDLSATLADHHATTACERRKTPVRFVCTIASHSGRAALRSAHGCDSQRCSQEVDPPELPRASARRGRRPAADLPTSHGTASARRPSARTASATGSSAASRRLHATT